VRTWVLDTNAVISGLISSKGPSAALVDAFFSERLQLAFDRRIVAEYAEVMARPKFGIEPQERQALLLKLHASGLRTEPERVTVKLPDEDDRPFIEVALATEEKVLVTRNRADFAAAEKLGVRVMSPEAAADLLRK
jgi:putative PIN family toxin of toxin-antitoxin system